MIGRENENLLINFMK